jgi:hypothetical protein
LIMNLKMLIAKFIFESSKEQKVKKKLYNFLNIDRGHRFKIFNELEWKLTPYHLLFKSFTSPQSFNCHKRKRRVTDFFGIMRMNLTFIYFIITVKKRQNIMRTLALLEPFFLQFWNKTIDCKIYSLIFETYAIE